MVSVRVAIYVFVCIYIICQVYVYIIYLGYIMIFLFSLKGGETWVRGAGVRLPVAGGNLHVCRHTQVWAGNQGNISVHEDKPCPSQLCIIQPLSLSPSPSPSLSLSVSLLVSLSLGLQCCSVSRFISEEVPDLCLRRVAWRAVWLTNHGRDPARSDLRLPVWDLVEPCSLLLLSLPPNHHRR